MDSLMSKILSEICRPQRRLSIISNPDGFLSREDTIEAFAKEGYVVLQFTQLQLRVWFETTFKDTSDGKYIVIMVHPEKVLADIRCEAFFEDFNARDLLLTYHQQTLDISNITYAMMLNLYTTRGISIKDKHSTETAVLEATTKFGPDGEDISIIKQNLMSVVVDWNKPYDTINHISDYIIKASKQGRYDELENELEFINFSFQRHLDEVYYSQMITATGPRVVHKTLPYITRTYSVGSKVALVVVDGMAFWQYVLLRKALIENSLEAKEQVSYSWLPSITKLSRQSIFRGEYPERDYRQNPTNEKKLWFDYWQARNFSDFRIDYYHDEKPKNLDSIERLAVVDTGLDEMMHHASNMKQLYRETEDWVTSFIPTINSLHEQGFEIILTSDHGSVFSHAWGSLSQHDRVQLYEDNSRGRRHLIFNNQMALQQFVDRHTEEIEHLLIHGDYVIWRNNLCFGTEDKITHGGSHMLEMIVPFITIKK